MLEAKNQLVVVSESLTGLIEEKAAALPRNFNKTRFLQNCLTVLKDTKGIEKCDPVSVAQTMMKGAYLGLDFFNGECYAIPFGTELTFLTDYKGDIKLARQYAIKPIKNIYARLVREGDEFKEEIIEGKPTLTFKPKTFGDGAIIGAFAAVLYDDDSMDYASMSKSEIEETRKNFSKCANSPAWIKSPGEMYKKTVIKRLCKMIELNFDNDDQDKAYIEGGDLDPNKVIDVTAKAGTVADPFKEKTSASATDDADSMIAVQNEIEQILSDKGKPTSMIHKLSMEHIGKQTKDLSLAELKTLKTKVEAM